MRPLKPILCAAAVWALAPAADAEVYLAPTRFLSDTFADQIPEPQVIWLTGPIREGVRTILGHDYPSLRLRYWKDKGRSAWILDEIGKDLPITTGIVIDGDRIENLKILEFRESRGWEVRYPFFTEQFDAVGLGADQRLNRPIDGISGATLSVGAVQRLALYLHAKTPAALAAP